MMIDPYESAANSVCLPKIVPFGPRWITQGPLLDPAPDGPGLAHLSYSRASSIAATRGARLPTRQEMFLLHDLASAAGTEITPVILPDEELKAQGAVPGDSAMSTLLWCQHADSKILSALASLPLDDSPVGNAGKSWIGPAPAGKAALCGWFVNGQPIQSGLGFPHDDQYFDYGTTTLLVWDVNPND